MAIPMQVTPGQLLPGFCPTSEQARLNAYAAALAITFPLTATAVNYGVTTPSSDQQALPWYRLNGDGTPDNWYVYANGAWIRPHPIPPGSAALQFYTGSFGSLATYDGGEVGAVTSASGPMWEVFGTADNTDPTDYGTMEGRLPIGVSADFPQGGTGGTDEHTLALTEMPPHAHGPGLASGTGFLYTGTGGGIGTVGGSSGSSALTSVVGGNPDGSTTAFNLMNPWYGGFWIQRTARVFYRV